MESESELTSEASYSSYSSSDVELDKVPVQGGMIQLPPAMIIPQQEMTDSETSDSESDVSDTKTGVRSIIQDIESFDNFDEQPDEFVPIHKFNFDDNYDFTDSESGSEDEQPKQKVKKIKVHKPKVKEPKSKRKDVEETKSKHRDTKVKEVKDEKTKARETRTKTKETRVKETKSKERAKEPKQTERGSSRRNEPKEEKKVQESLKETKEEAKVTTKKEVIDDAPVREFDSTLEEDSVLHFTIDPKKLKPNTPVFRPTEIPARDETPVRRRTSTKDNGSPSSKESPKSNESPKSKESPKSRDDSRKFEIPLSPPKSNVSAPTPVQRSVKPTPVKGTNAEDKSKGLKSNSKSEDSKNKPSSKSGSKATSAKSSRERSTNSKHSSRDSSREDRSKHSSRGSSRDGSRDGSRDSSRDSSRGSSRDSSRKSSKSSRSSSTLSNEDIIRDEKKRREKEKGHRFRKALAAEEMKEKRELIYELYKMEQRGLPVSKRFTQDDELDEIRFEYNKLKSEDDIKEKVRVGWNMFSCVNSIVELVNEKLDPFNLSIDGWSDELDKDKEKYEPHFRKLYKQMSCRFQVKPGVQIGMLYMSQFLIFLVPKLLKKIKSKKTPKETKPKMEQPEEFYPWNVPQSTVNPPTAIKVNQLVTQPSAVEFNNLMKQLNDMKSQMNMYEKKLEQRDSLLRQQDNIIQQYKRKNSNTVSGYISERVIDELPKKNTDHITPQSTASPIINPLSILSQSANSQFQTNDNMEELEEDEIYDPEAEDTDLPEPSDDFGFISEIAPMLKVLRKVSNQDEDDEPQFSLPAELRMFGEVPETPEYLLEGELNDKPLSEPETKLQQSPRKTPKGKRGTKLKL